MKVEDIIKEAEARVQQVINKGDKKVVVYRNDDGTEDAVVVGPEEDESTADVNLDDRGQPMIQKKPQGPQRGPQQPPQAPQTGGYSTGSQTRTGYKSGVQQQKPTDKLRTGQRIQIQDENK